MFLQATCPLRTGADIDAAVALLEATGADSLVSVSPAHLFLWEERDGQAVAVNRAGSSTACPMEATPG